MPEIWDLEDAASNADPDLHDAAGRATPTCSRLHRDPRPFFRRVFRNDVYDVLQVLDTPTTS